MTTLTLAGVYNQDRVDLLAKILKQSDTNRRFSNMNGVTVSMKPYSITDRPTMKQLEEMLAYVENKYDALRQALKLKIGGINNGSKASGVTDEVSERIENILEGTTMTEQCTMAPPNDDFDGDELVVHLQTKVPGSAFQNTHDDIESNGMTKSFADSTPTKAVGKH